MIAIIEQAHSLDEFFGARGWPACIIGGVANLRWGQLRLTRDVDATVLAGFGDEDRFINAILEAFRPRIADAAAFARANRVVLAQGPGGIGLDISLGALPFEEAMIARATRAELAPGCWVTTASAEDLIVLKAFADRPQDWVDIAGIVARQGSALDWPAITERLAPLATLKEAPEILSRLDRARRES